MLYRNNKQAGFSHPFAAVIAGLCLVCALAVTGPHGASAQPASAVNYASGVCGQALVTDQFLILLYDEYGFLVNATGVCYYQQGHVFDAYGHDIGVVEYQTGHVFDSLGNMIGFVLNIEEA